MGTLRKILFHIQKGIIFLGIFCLLFSLTSSILVPETRYMQASKSFYDLPRNSLDVLFLGGSSIYTGINPLEMWKDYGFTGFIRASGVQPPIVSYYYLLEALKYQKPRVVVIEASGLFNEFMVDKEEGLLRRSIDPMRFSKEKLQLISEIVSISKRQTASSYVFPLLRFHSRWLDISGTKTLLPNDKVIEPYKGFSGLHFDTKIVDFPENYMQPVNTLKEFSSDVQYYQKMIRLCQENNIQVVIVTMPRLQWSYSKYLAVQQLADENNVFYIDFCLDEYRKTLNLDHSKDFIDEGHLNLFGAQKISNQLGGYLQEKYILPDRRNDPAYQQWNIDAQFFEDELAKALAEIAE